MTENLAYEVRPFGIRVVAIEPGIVATRIFENSEEMNHFDKRSPYLDLMRRTGWLYRVGIENAARPEDVAATIRGAVEAETPILRHLVGDDARKLVGGHREVSDEDFLALANLDDDAYRARFKEIYGIDL